MRAVQSSMCGRLVVLIAIAHSAIPIALQGQVLFPGNTADRRSRTFDVVHYKLVLDLDETRKQVSGTTSITFTPLDSRLDSIVLDAEAMNIKAVSFARGAVCRFANRSPQLAVFFTPPLHFSDTVTVAIEYACTPKSGLYFIQPDASNPSRRKQIWSQGEDTDNHFWFPCYDYPDDKATSEVIATVPEAYELLSNGKLVATTRDSVKKTRTFHWVQSKPHSSYLIMIAAGEYSIVREQERGVSLEYYLYKDRVQDGMRSLSKTAAAMTFFERKIGFPYPWDKYAQIWISNFMWGGMENTSAVTLNDESYLLDAQAAVDFSSDDVVAHELSHQWWGDLITARDWSHLWLHEGFANYFQVLFKQDQKGDDYSQYDLMQQARSVFTTEETQGRSSLVAREAYTTNVYSKGCWVLHMLRNILGEQSFWRAIQTYAKRYAFKNVDSYEFMRAIEDATGRNLEWFFEQWVYKAGHPRVKVTSRWDNYSSCLLLGFTQTQEIDSLTGIFKFPLDIECTTSSGIKSTSVFVDQQQQHVSIPLPEKPLMTIIDKGKTVLASFEMKKSTEEYIFQLSHASDVTDRIEAARALRFHNSEANVFSALREAALRDKFWAVRDQAVLALAASDDRLTKQTLFTAARDKHSSVRSSAIDALSRFTTPDVAAFVMNAACDSSLLVISACMRTLTEIDTLQAFDLASKYVELDSYRDILRRAAFDVFLAMHDPRAIPFALKYSAVGNREDIRRQAVRLLGRIGKNDHEVKGRLLVLAADSVNTIRRAAIESIAMWKSAEAREAIRLRRGKESDEMVRTAIDRALDSLARSLPDSIH